MTAPTVLITGAPGVGKSTVAGALARRAARAAHVEADQLQHMILAGGQWPSAGTDDAFRQLLLRTRNAAALAASYSQAGFVAVLDEVVATGEQLRLVDAAVPPERLTAFVLTSPQDVILDRDAHRSKHTAGNYLGIGELVLEALDGRATVIDSSCLTIEETVDAIVAQLPWPLDEPVDVR